MEVYAWLIDWLNPLSEKLPHGDDFRVDPKSDRTPRDKTIHVPVERFERVRQVERILFVNFVVSDGYQQRYDNNGETNAGVAVFLLLKVVDGHRDIRHQVRNIKTCKNKLQNTEKWNTQRVPNIFLIKPKRISSYTLKLLSRPYAAPL